MVPVVEFLTETFVEGHERRFGGGVVGHLGASSDPQEGGDGDYVALLRGDEVRQESAQDVELGDDIDAKGPESDGQRKYRRVVLIRPYCFTSSSVRSVMSFPWITPALLTMTVGSPSWREAWLERKLLSWSQNRRASSRICLATVSTCFQSETSHL